MDKIITNIFKIIEYTFDRKLEKLRQKIDHNKREFASVCKRKDEIHDKIMDLYRIENEEVTATDQINLMFRMLQQDPLIEELLVQEKESVSFRSFFSFIFFRFITQPFLFYRELIFRGFPTLLRARENQN